MPRRRGQLVRAPIHLGAGRANPVTTLGPDLYTAVAGGFRPEEEPARLPPTHTVVASNGAPATIRTPHATPPPVAGPGQSVIAPTAQLGTVAPTSAIRTPAQIHQEKAHRLRQAALASLAPLRAPISPSTALTAPTGQTLEDQVAFFSAELGMQERNEGPQFTHEQAQDLLSKVAPLPAVQHVVSTTPVADRSYTVQTPRGAVRIPASAVASDPQDPLGPGTLGNVTLGQLQKAAQAGTLGVSKKGVLTTQEGRQVLDKLLQAHQHYVATNSLQGPLTPGQKTFAETLSRATGGVLHPATVATQELQEESGSAAQQREGEHNFDALNIGYTDSGPLGLTTDSVWNDPRTAAKATAEFFEGKKYSPSPAIAAILQQAKGKSVAQQLQIIGNSGWATSAYATDLAATSKLVSEGHDPQAAIQLQAAKKQARANGINPTPWNGDVEGGTNDYVYVRADAKGAVDWARSTVGTQEGSPRQLHWAELEKLGPSEPWCTDWVSVNLGRRGVELPSNPNYSGAYADPDWKGGTQLGTDISKAKPGDLIVYGHDEHIAMYAGNGKVIAGNYGDEVAEYGATEDPRGITAIVRPHYKGGRVKVKAGQIPGSSVESTFGGSTSSGGEVVTGAPGQTQTQTVAAGSGGNGAQGQAELASLTLPTGPSFSAQVAQPTFEGEGEGEQIWRALLAAATGSRA